MRRSGSAASGSSAYQVPRAHRSLVAVLIAAYVGSGTKTNSGSVLELKVPDVRSAPGQALSRECSCHIPLDILELSASREPRTHQGCRYLWSVCALRDPSTI